MELQYPTNNIFPTPHALNFAPYTKSNILVDYKSSCNKSSGLIIVLLVFYEYLPPELCLFRKKGLPKHPLRYGEYLAVPNDVQTNSESVSSLSITTYLVEARDTFLNLTDGDTSFHHLLRSEHSIRSKSRFCYKVYWAYPILKCILLLRAILSATNRVADGLIFTPDWANFLSMLGSIWDYLLSMMIKLRFILDSLIIMCLTFWVVKMILQS